VRTLILVTAVQNPMDQDELLKLERVDKHPRATLFPRTLNADLLDRKYLEKVPGPRRVLYSLFPVWLAQVTEAYFRRREYDAIISWGEHLTIAFALLLRLTRTRVPHVALSYSILERRKARLLRLVQKRIDKLVLWTSAARDFALSELRIPESKIVRVRWGVDQKFYRPLGTTTDMICSAGREMRDYGTLIEALRGTDIRCHIAAYSVPGKKDAWVKAVEDAKPLQPNVTIGKMKSVAELRALYAQSRFVVLPLLQNKADSGTGAMMQAMAMGRAVICSKTRGQQDHIQDGKTGIYVPVGDPKALREAIQYLWDNPEIAERMGREARTFVEQYHTLDQFVDEVKRAVEGVLRDYGSLKKHVTQVRK
jgi:glycosyltransferase involved in cell wall biosynthesis